MNTMKNFNLTLLFSMSCFLLMINACDKKNSPTNSENQPPTASFSVSPESNTTNAIFSFDASGCSDNEDPIDNLQVRWDWENDGTWDTEYSTNKFDNHQYSAEGTKTIVLEVRDTGGLTATTTNSVIVSDVPVNFRKSSQRLGNTRSFAVAIADIDLDNDNDIFIANYIGSSTFWTNNGQGVFSQNSQSLNPAITSSVHDVGMADLNGDSYPDIFIISHNVHNKVYLNDGAGRFNDSGQNIGSLNDDPDRIQLCDVDCDNDLDAMIDNMNAPNRLWLNSGNGTFTMKNIDYGGSDCQGLKLADFNGDSFPDLFICLRTQPNQVWMNDGSGNFSNSGQSFGDAEDVDCKDIDGDGDIDILEASYRQIKVWYNQNNTGTFSAGSIFGDGAFKCKLFDADLDGDMDLATAHMENGNKFWLNDGTGTFTSLGTVFGTTRVLSIAYAKLNADDKYDVLLGKLEGTGGNEIYFNE